MLQSYLHAIVTVSRGIPGDLMLEAKSRASC